MSQVTLQGITKHFRIVTALSEVSFDIKDGEFFVLLGPTGAGKTTTLRVIAGLEKQDAGSVTFDGEPVDKLPPAERDIAFVFQQYSLYPNMSVYDNLAFPLRSPMRKTEEAEIKQRVGEIAEVLRISHLLPRKTAKLSGGEMQRVSIGRAIVRSPRIYLMDEPLSNLDAKLREALRLELAHLQKTQKSTTLFVTHDGRADRRAEPGPHRADRHADRHLRPPGDDVRGTVGRLTENQPDGRQLRGRHAVPGSRR
jgi:multiple sugar transport system ATP-binding protein